MPRSQVPARTGPKREIATELKKKNREYTMPTGGNMAPKGTREEMWAQDFQKAKDHLAILNAASAVENMQRLPTGLLEMYLLAEEVGQGREMVLHAFPKAGVRARERYLSAATPVAPAKTRRAPRQAQPVKDDNDHQEA